MILLIRIRPPFQTCQAVYRFPVYLPICRALKARVSRFVLFTQSINILTLLTTRVVCVISGSVPIFAMFMGPDNIPPTLFPSPVRYFPFFPSPHTRHAVTCTPRPKDANFYGLQNGSCDLVLLFPDCCEFGLPVPLFCFISWCSSKSSSLGV